MEPRVEATHGFVRAPAKKSRRLHDEIAVAEEPVPIEAFHVDAARDQLPAMVNVIGIAVHDIDFGTRRKILRDSLECTAGAEREIGSRIHGQLATGHQRYRTPSHGGERVRGEADRILPRGWKQRVLIAHRQDEVAVRG